VFLSPEGGDSMFLQSPDICLHVYTASQPIRMTSSSSSLSREPQISQRDTFWLSSILLFLEVPT
jgi:hypothetical protein